MGKQRKALSELAPKTQEDWEKVKEHPGLIVVDVFPEWAGPCDVMKPIIYKIKSKGDYYSMIFSKFSDKIKLFGRINPI